MLNLIKKSPHRNQLEQYLQEYLPRLTGAILDIGSKNRRYDYLMKERPTAIDIIENVSKDVKGGDINNLKFEDGSFENIVSLEVLEYINTPEKAIKEIHRVLSDGGSLILSVPFMYAFHDDQLRYTENYLKSLLSDFKTFEIFSIGNAYTIMLDIMYGKIKKIKFPLFKYLATVIYSPFTLFFPRKIHKGGNYTSGYFIVAKK